VNSSSPRKNVTPETAIQYLSARKFDIPKAVALYEANSQTRQREELYGIDSTVDPLRSELATEKFTVLVSQIDRIIRRKFEFLPGLGEGKENLGNQNNEHVFGNVST
jgi:hypothetical protein